MIRHENELSELNMNFTLQVLFYISLKLSLSYAVCANKDPSTKQSMNEISTCIGQQNSRICKDSEC